MEIEETFRLDLPVPIAWPVLIDLERIVTWLPGANLVEIEGDEHRGTLQIQLGAIAADLTGTARLEAADDVTHTAVFVASGHDLGGKGDASVTIRLTLLVDGDGTRVDVETDLSLAGELAQFGRGVMADASAKLVTALVENLERDVRRPDVLRPDVLDLTEGDVPSGAESQDRDDRDDIPDELVADAVAAEAEPAAAPSGNGAAVRRAEPDDVEPIDLLETGGSPILRRAAPLAAFVLIAVLVRYLVRRRKG